MEEILTIFDVVINYYSEDEIKKNNYTKAKKEYFELKTCQDKLNEFAYERLKNIEDVIMSEYEYIKNNN